MMIDVPPNDTSAPNTPLKKIGTNAINAITLYLHILGKTVNIFFASYINICKIYYEK